MNKETIFENKNYKDINPIHTGFEKCEKGYGYGPAIRENYLIHYCASGEGTLFAPEGAYKVRAGQIFLIKPGEITTYIADDKNPWEYIWIGFSGETAKMLENATKRVAECASEPFDNIRSLKNEENFREEKAISALFLILPSFFEETSGNLATKVKNYIKANYMQHISVDGIAKSVGYSRQHLSRTFKKETGTGVRDFLIGIRLEKGKKFLKDGFSVHESAYLCGYEDAFNFSRAFKKRFGVSPSEEKNMHNYTKCE